MGMRFYVSHGRTRVVRRGRAALPSTAAEFRGRQAVPLRHLSLPTDWGAH
jgi:hypothetical protein